MSEDDYTAELKEFLEAHCWVALRLIREALSKGCSGDYIYFRIETDAIRGGVPFFAFEVSEADCSFAPCLWSEPTKEEFNLPEYLHPDLWDEAPEDRYKIVGECVLKWIEDCVAEIQTEIPCFAAETDQYRIYNLHAKVWHDADFWH